MTGINSSSYDTNDTNYYLYTQAYLIKPLTDFTMQLEISNYLQATSVVTTT